jgi:nitroimidazol reductase NimA-like FMN-containing flavoprotein (pyridoxamine 5'-phosphate oxidase superfamily)
MKGELNVQQMEELLCNQEVGRIGCSINGRVNIIPVTYAYDGDLVYWIAPEELNMDALRQSPDICFEVELMPDLGNWKYVLAWGSFRELVGSKERDQALKCLARNHHADISGLATKVSPEWPFVSTGPGVTSDCVHAIKLRQKSGGYEVFESEGAKVHVC